MSSAVFGIPFERASRASSDGIFCDVRFPPVADLQPNVRVRPIADIACLADDQGVKHFAGLVLLALAVPANASEASLCTALASLKKAATTSRTDQVIKVFKEEPMTFACERRKNVAAQVAFCSAALKEVGVEFTHGFPWKVYDCLIKVGVRPKLTLVEQYTGVGRKKINHLSGFWRDGTGIEIQFERTGDVGDEAEFKDYWGYYRLVVSPLNTAASRP